MQVIKNNITSDQNIRKHFTVDLDATSDLNKEHRDCRFLCMVDVD